MWTNNKYATEPKGELNCGIVEENAQSKPNVLQKSLTNLSGEQLSTIDCED